MSTDNAYYSLDHLNWSANGYLGRLFHIGEEQFSPNSWSPLHWIIALLPGTYFAITNYVQHAVITSWFSSGLAAFLILFAFLFVYNAYALVVRALWKIASSWHGLRAETRRWRLAMAYFMLLLTAGTTHLFMISVLTSVTREAAEWRSAVGSYFVEIWISCLPIWGLIFMLTLGLCMYFQNSPAKRVENERDKAHQKFPRLVLRDQGRTHYVAPQCISLVEAHGDYVKVYSSQGVLMPKSSITRLEEDLKPYGPFLRVHRSSLVQADRIRAVRRLPSGAYSLELDDGREVPLSRRKVSLVRDILNKDAISTM